MKFDSLKEKCNYYRSLSDYKLLPNSYVIIMLDGRSFSARIKNKFKKPFDDNFINMMNETAKYLCANVQGCKFAYVQSDEISLVITDFDTPTTDSFFGNRLCKIQSICASMATAKFNNLMMQYKLRTSIEGSQVIAENIELYEFDCKAWNVPTYNDVFAWFLYRQIDCIRNSKQQAAQAYLPHKQLMNLNADAQIELLAQEKGIKWEDFSACEKYGRFIRKEKKECTAVINGEEKTFERYLWIAVGGFPLMSEYGKEDFNSFVDIPILV